jgi:hypothetical protein
MPPADPPPPVPDPSADVPAAPAGPVPARRRPVHAPGRLPALTTEWTTTRAETLDCAGCGAPFLLSYKYRFVEGLSATIVRCPAAACRRGREYYLPVNAFDVIVTPSGAPSRL